MKKLIIFLILAMFFVISCSSSKKAENDVDILPDEDAVDEDTNIMPDEDSADEDIEFVVFGPCEPNPCENLANSDGTCSGKKNGGFECGCIESYFWNGKECVNPCENVSCSQLNHASGTCNPKNALAFSCDCDEGYFWGYLGCKKIALPNICTGQTMCYDMEKEIDCPEQGKPFYGQDAQYAALGYCIEQTFSKKTFSNSDAVIDLNAEKTAFDDLFKTEWTYEFIKTDPFTWEEAIQYCEDFEYGGHDDWRLPTMKELLLSNKVDSDYNETWSSDEYAADDSYAWTADNRRTWAFNSKTRFHRVARCVRGEHIDMTVFFDTLGKLNEVVAFDYEHGLAWQLYAGHTGKFEKALEYCENSNYSGFSDWRLPNVHELASIINLEKYSPASDLPLHLILNNSWTSTNQYYMTSGVNLKTGKISSIDKDSGANIVCVRNEPCKKGHFWDGFKCVQSPCTDEPCKNEAHSDGVCYLIDFESYECGCVEGYFWDGIKCVSPCDPNPCGNDKHSTGECTAISLDFYNCGCVENHFWNGKKCVNPCDGVSCGDFEHAKGKCKADSAFIYSCGCDEGYYWWNKDKGCIAKRPAAVNICTGQTKCYNNKKEILCSTEENDFFGQDAHYSMLGLCIPQSFLIDYSVKDEPVVIDNNLGLMWQRNKIPPVEELYIEDVKQHCSDLVYGGYDDWRVPYEEDFITIADYGRYDPAVDTGYFPDSGEFWTASKSTSYTSWFYGEFVEYREYHTIFDSNKPYTYNATTYIFGFDGEEIKPYSFKIRCVRGDNDRSNPEHYFMPEIYGENLMLSDHTLIVMKKPDTDYTWAEALKYCRELDYAGISDWKLPNIKEAILSAKIGFGNSGRSRTSTTKISDPDFDFSFSDSSLYTKEEKVTTTVFCVTDDPCGKGKFWNGEKCVKNPCEPNPCESENALNRTCKIVDENSYICGCDLCMDIYKEHSTGKCYENKYFGSSCECVEGYHWDNWDYPGCVKD